MDPSRTSGTIQTLTGKLVRPFELCPTQIDLRDIFGSLSKLCRFNGHTKKFYSVAQHCCIICDEIQSRKVGISPGETRRLAKWGLLHDAAEAYIGDIPRPLKGLMPNVKAIENSILANIAGMFNLGPYPERLIEQLDQQMLVTEQRDLLVHCEWPNAPKSKPLPEEIVPWKPEVAELGMHDRWTLLNVM